MLDPPQILDVAAQPTAVIHLTLGWPQMQQKMGPAMQEVIAAVTGQNATVTGAMFSFHFRRPTDTLDFEVGLPVASAVTAVGRVKPSTLPALRVLRTVYHGPYEGLGDAWGQFIAWAAEHGHTVQPSLWECYTVGPQHSANAADWCTELSLP